MLSFYLSTAAVAQKCSRRYETCKDNIFISHQIFVYAYIKKIKQNKTKYDSR